MGYFDILFLHSFLSKTFLLNTVPLYAKKVKIVNINDKIVSFFFEWVCYDKRINN